MLTFLIMAGGSGERFWPLSTKQKPKQLLKIFSDKSLIRLAYERILPLVDKDKIFILNTGDSVVLSKGKVKRGYPVEHGNTYIDGKDINSLAEAVIDDRRILMDDGSRIVFRLSGTSSSGATLRVYLEKLEKEKFDKKPLDMVTELLEIAMNIAEIEKRTGKKQADIIT